MSNYCGKDCTACTYKEELSCTGCQSGPGRIAGGDCKLADCCREKGHESCETCELKRNCGKWLDKGSIPMQRMERRQEEQEKQAIIKRRAPFLGKWLWLLFWVTIAYMVLNFLSENAASWLSALEMPALIGSQLCRLFIIYILFTISKEHYYYKTASILSGVCLAISILSSFLPGNSVLLPLLIAVIQTIITLMAEYYEYKANAEVVLVADGQISEQWDTYWNWNIYSSIGIVVSLFLVLIIPALGSLTMLASSIALIVARVKKLICMYRSAKVFRELTE